MVNTLVGGQVWKQLPDKCSKGGTEFTIGGGPCGDGCGKNKDTCACMCVSPPHGTAMPQSRLGDPRTALPHHSRAVAAGRPRLASATPSCPAARTATTSATMPGPAATARPAWGSSCMRTAKSAVSPASNPAPCCSGHRLVLCLRQLRSTHVLPDAHRRSYSLHACSLRRMKMQWACFTCAEFEKVSDAPEKPDGAPPSVEMQR